MYPLEVKDQLHKTIRLESAPKRIVSLVPSQTEFLADLGLSDALVGITKFCIHPKGLLTPQRNIGGTKKLKLEKIAALQPDIIIGNKEENTLEDILWLQDRFPVWMSDIETLEHAYDMMHQIGTITNKHDVAEKIIENIKQAFKQLKSSISALNAPLKSIYLIWNNPIMVAGPQTFIQSIMDEIGLENLVQQARYPVLSEAALLALNPELILLSSEPYPFNAKHLAHFQKICPNSKVLLVDGEYFSWYGSRLSSAPLYFKSIIS